MTWLGERILRLVAGRSLGPSAATELDEEFRTFILPERGTLRARLWYGGQVLRSTPHFLRLRVRGESEAPNGVGGASGFGGPGPEGPGDGRVRRILRSTRFAFRVLRRRPVLSGAAVLTLALALGFSTAAYGVLEAVLLRSLPYEAPQKLVWVHPDWPLAPAHIDAIRANARSLTEVGGFERRLLNFLDGNQDPEQVRGAAVTANHFDMLGSGPVLGRGFLPEESQPDGGNVIILSHALWASRYGSDPGIVGRTVDLGLPVPYTVVGIMGPGHRPIEEDWAAWVPLRLDPASEGWDFWRSAYAIGRMADGSTPDGVNGEVAQIIEEYVTRVPGTAFRIEDLAEARVVPLEEVIVGPVRQGIWALVIGVGLLLLIACANVGNLLMALASARQRELAVRRALGADRGQIVRQLFTESMVLAVLGGTGGMALAHVALPAAVRLLPPDMPRTDEIGISFTVLIVGVGLALVSGALAGALPAYLQSRNDPGVALQGSGRSGVTRVTRRTHTGLIILESALAVVVAVGAGLMLRSFNAALSEDPGFNPQNVVAVRPSLARARYPTDQDRAQFFMDAQERLAALPGVEEVGGILFLPMTSGGWRGLWAVIGTDLEDEESWKGISNRTVLPGYFESMGMRVLHGRSLTREDLAENQVTVVNQAAARLLFGEDDVVGREVTRDSELPPRRIVGVVEDVRQGGLDADPLPEMYHPLTAEQVRGGLYLTVKAAGEAEPVLLAARQALLDLDPRIPIPHAEALTATVRRSVTMREVSALGAGAFALFGLLLGAVGIYGVTSFQVSTQMREVGVRVALGARSTRIVRGVVVRGLLPVQVGVGVGVASAWMAGGAIESLVYGIPARDPTTLLAVAGILTGVALIAQVGPALRASRADPVEVLNQE